MTDVFKQGDIIFLDFDPQAGHEQRGRRPALVISNNTYNRFSRMIMVCPITNTDKKHPFHVRLDDRTKATGVILCDQARTLDVQTRHGEFAEKAPDDITGEALDIVMGFIEIR